METNYNELFRNVLNELRTIAKTETVIGEQFKLGEFTCVPIIKVNIGFGSGSGSGDSPKQGKGGGGGVGAGANVQPIAFLVSRGDEIRMLNVGKAKGFESFFEKMPEMMDKVMDMKKNSKEETPAADNTEE